MGLKDARRNPHGAYERFQHLLGHSAGAQNRRLALEQRERWDSTPYWQEPAVQNERDAARPRSSITCCAVVGLGRPERFALGAAIGTPDVV